MKKRGQMKAEAPAGPKTGTTRRSFLKQVGRAGLVAAGVPLVGPRVSVAAPVTLSMWSCFPEIEQFYKKAGDEYAKTHPSFKLETLSADIRSMEQKIAAAIPTDTGPDLFDVSRNIILSLADANLVPPNPPKVMTLLKSKAFHPSVVEFNTWKGQVYGVPFLEGSKPALYYNTKMFQAKGITSPPKTYSELVADAKKLTVYNTDGSIKVAGFVPLSNFYESAQIENGIWNDAQWYASDGKSAFATDQKWTQLFEWQKSFIDALGYDKLTKFYAQIGGANSEWNAQQAFMTGKVAMALDGEWRTAFIQREALFGAEVEDKPQWSSRDVLD